MLDEKGKTSEVLYFLACRDGKLSMEWLRNVESDE